MSLKELLNLDFLSVKGAWQGINATNHNGRLSYEDLVNAESELGRTLFGPIPVGHQREFFESKKNVWIWHENWLDEAGAQQSITIRYEVRPTGVYKKSFGGEYSKIEGTELDNFVSAVRSYYKLVTAKLYS